MNFNNEVKNIIIIFLYWYKDIMFFLNRLTIVFIVTALINI